MKIVPTVVSSGAQGDLAVQKYFHDLVDETASKAQFIDRMKKSQSHNEDKEIVCARISFKAESDPQMDSAISASMISPLQSSSIGDGTIDNEGTQPDSRSYKHIEASHNEKDNLLPEQNDVIINQECKASSVQDTEQDREVNPTGSDKITPAPSCYFPSSAKAGEEDEVLSHDVDQMLSILSDQLTRTEIIELLKAAGSVNKALNMHFDKHRCTNSKDSKSLFSLLSRPKLKRSSPQVTRTPTRKQAKRLKGQRSIFSFFSPAKMEGANSKDVDVDTSSMVDNDQPTNQEALEQDTDCKNDMEEYDEPKSEGIVDITVSKVHTTLENLHGYHEVLKTIDTDDRGVSHAGTSVDVAIKLEADSYSGTIADGLTMLHSSKQKCSLTGEPVSKGNDSRDGDLPESLSPEDLKEILQSVPTANIQATACSATSINTVNSNISRKDASVSGCAIGHGAQKSMSSKVDNGASVNTAVQKPLQDYDPVSLISYVALCRRVYQPAMLLSPLFRSLRNRGFSAENYLVTLFLLWR